MIPWSNFSYKSGGFELASTITLALQAQRLTKYNFNPLFSSNKKEMATLLAFPYPAVIKYFDFYKVT